MRKREAQKLAKIYLRAADAIQEKGHVIGHLADDRGRMCVLGAIGLVVDGDPMSWSSDAYGALGPLNEMLGQDVIDWNNKSSRKKRDVVAMLRRAARHVVSETAR
jgi:hypothetical protein